MGVNSIDAALSRMEFVAGIYFAEEYNLNERGERYKLK